LISITAFQSLDGSLLSLRVGLRGHDYRNRAADQHRRTVQTQGKTHGTRSKIPHLIVVARVGPHPWAPSHFAALSAAALEKCKAIVSPFDDPPK
jgi:hypothetical protein